MNQAPEPSVITTSPARPRNPRIIRTVLPCVLAILSLLLFVPGALAWTVQDMTVNPEGGTVAPVSLVTVSCMVRFDPAMEADGRTFDAGHTLFMTTELAGATWSATLVNIGRNRDPVTTPLGARTGPEYRIDGGTLSYADADLNLIVTIRGTAPDTRDQERIIVSVRELDENGIPVPDKGDTVMYLVADPATAATTLMTPVKTSGVTTATTAPRETTRAPGGAVHKATPTARPTYSPGPDAITVIAILALAGFMTSLYGRRRAP